MPSSLYNQSAAQLNQRSLKRIMRTLTLSEGVFTLIIAHCNYIGLRLKIAEQMLHDAPLKIHQVALPSSVKTLYTYLNAQLRDVSPQAVMVMGFESIDEIDRVLIAANQVREEFRKNLRCPLVLWVNDNALNRFMRVAPDFKSWSGSPIRFEPEPDDLLAALHYYVAFLFAETLEESTLAEDIRVADDKPEPIANLLKPSELDAFRVDARILDLESDLELNAGLQLLQGYASQQRGDYITSLNQFNMSLFFWKKTQNNKHAAALHYYMAGCYEQKGELKEACRHYRKGLHLIRSHDDLNQSLKSTFKINLIIHQKYTLKLCNVLLQLEKWEEMQAAAAQVLPLEGSGFEHHYELIMRAAIKQFLAEAALHNEQWEQAVTITQRALDNIKAVLKAKDETAITIQIRDNHRYLLASAQYHLNKTDQAIKNLESARVQGQPQQDPFLYIKILKRLHLLYIEEKDYLKAFRIKLEQHSLEKQYGFRAFIGAGSLKPLRQIQQRQPYNNPSDIAREISASERQIDLDRLIEKIGRPDSKLIVIHGPSGVGKSSILEAGLVPALNQAVITMRDVMPLHIRNYLNWAGQLREQLNKRLMQASPDKPTPPADIDDILCELRLNDERNLLTVLIFDQFEEFFFVEPENPSIRNQDHNPGRRLFYDFLNDCLNTPFVKVILSLREDYLHLLLQLDKVLKTDVINNDILNKRIRYALGNFTPQDARAVIENLTQSADQFHVSPQLIDKLVEDLARDTGEVRPIELQIVGVQIQTEQIRTLAQYKPKDQLVKGFIEEVIQDCGAPNEQLTRVVLYLLTDGPGEYNLLTRPLKTKSELAKELKDAEMEADDAQLELILEILVGTGLIFQIPGKTHDRYQIVHDYLTPLFRKGRGGELLAQVQAEKKKRKIAEQNLSKVLKRQLRFSRILGVLIALLLSTTGLLFYYKAVKEKKQAELAEYKAIDEKKNAELRLKMMEEKIKRKKEEEQLAQATLVLAQEQTKILNENLKKAEVSAMNALLQSSKAHFLSNNGLDALLIGVKAGLMPENSDLPQESVHQAIANLREVVSNIHEKNRLQGHESPVAAVSISHDGQLAASGSYDNTIKIWRVSDGRLLHTLYGHTDSILDVCFSPVSEILATAGADAAIKLWHAQSGKLIRTFEGHKDAVNSIAFSSTGDMLASGSRDKTIRLWKVADGTALKAFTAHDGAVFSVSFNPDSKLLASGGDDNKINLWDVKTGRRRTTLKGHYKDVHSVSFSPDGHSLVSGSDDHTIRIWDVTGNTEPRVLQGHAGSVFSVTFAPDGNTLASAGHDNAVKIWDMRDDTVVMTFFGHSGSVRDLCFNPGGTILASAGFDRSVRLWCYSYFSGGAGRNVVTRRNHLGPVYSVNFSPDGKTLVSGSFDNTVKLWPVDLNNAEKTLKWHLGAVSAVQFHPDGQIVASASSDHTIKLWDVRTGKQIRHLKGHSANVRCLAFSPDGRLLVSGDDARIIKLWSINDGKAIHTFKGHSGSVLSVAISPGGQLLASGSDDKTIKLWNLQDGRLLDTLTRHYNAVFSLGFDSTGQRLASGSFDSTIKIWRIVTGDNFDGQGELMTTLAGHPGNVRSVAFSPDGLILASGGDDTAIKLWNLADGVEINTLRGHSGIVYSVAFSPDGHFLASGSGDSSIKLWELSAFTNSDLGELIADGCRHLKGYLENNPLVSEEDRHLCD
ncbi:hypothetical protein QUF90_02650 [Desulfococcaceae bacterium HSG9]|nr:hypothetical protein [Desulfococcaceae bacterium HSG9]